MHRMQPHFQLAFQMNLQNEQLHHITQTQARICTFNAVLYAFIFLVHLIIFIEHQKWFE